MSQFYLTAFASPQGNRLLWVYDKDSGRVVQKPPKAVAFGWHYHSFIDESGQLDTHSIEAAFGRIEAIAPRAIRRAAKHQHLEPDERAILALFTGLSVSRVPQFRHNIEQLMVGVKRHAIEMSRALKANQEAGHEIASMPISPTARPLDLSREEIDRALADPNYEVVGNPLDSLEVIDAGLDLALPIAELNWNFLVAPSGTYFVTCDNPVCLDGPLRGAEAGLIFPLTQSVALVCTRTASSPEYVRLDRSQVLRVNERVVANATRYVYAPQHDRQILDLVKGHKDSAPLWRSTGGPLSSVRPVPARVPTATPTSYPDVRSRPGRRPPSGDRTDPS